MPLTIEIREPTSTEAGIQYLDSEVHGVESKIQDCLAFPYMGRSVQ